MISPYIEAGEAESVVSLLQIGPPVLHEKSSKVGSTEEALVQVSSLLMSANISGCLLGGALLLGAAVFACCCCPMPSQWASIKDSPAEILPPVSDKKNGTASQRSTSSSDCCCGAGILSWIRSFRGREGSQHMDPETQQSGARQGATLQGEPAVGFVPLPPAEHLEADGHVNFTGHWKCMEAGGELDAVFADMGIGYLARKFMASFGWGKGTVCRTYEQNGIHMKVTESAIQETTQEFDVNGEEQKVNGGDFDFLQTTYWDPHTPHLLRWKGTDLEKAQPKQWTRTCQYFLDKDHLRIETTCSSEKTAWWVYKRETRET